MYTICSQVMQLLATVHNQRIHKLMFDTTKKYSAIKMWKAKLLTFSCYWLSLK